MSAEALPIDPMRFAEALTDLPPSTLALKLLELRNSVAHLDYSNAELKPFADGTTATLDQQSQQAPQPDQDCIDAIAENEAVIARMQARIELIRAEVERRGLSWQAFQQAKEATAATAAAEKSEDAATTNGAVNGHGGGDGQSRPVHEAWTDGTFQTGTLRADMTDQQLLELVTGRIPPESQGQTPPAPPQQPPQRQDESDPDGGMHL